MAIRNVNYKRLECLKISLIYERVIVADCCKKMLCNPKGWTVKSMSFGEIKSNTSGEMMEWKSAENDKSWKLPNSRQKMYMLSRWKKSSCWQQATIFLFITSFPRQREHHKKKHPQQRLKSASFTKKEASTQGHTHGDFSAQASGRYSQVIRKKTDGSVEIGAELRGVVVIRRNLRIMPEDTRAKQNRAKGYNEG